MKGESWKTADIALATSLKLLGNYLEGIELDTYGGRSMFVFTQTPKLEQQVNDYWQGGLRVDPKDFSSSLRELKSRLH
jgi:hypothetical protein